MDKKKVKNQAKHITTVIGNSHNLTSLRELRALEKSILRGEIKIREELQKKLNENRDEIRKYKAFVRAYDFAIKYKENLVKK